MTLVLQLALGHLGEILIGALFTLVLTGVIPLLIWLIVGIILWFFKRRKPLKWWAITMTACCLYGLLAFGYCRVFTSAPFMIAQRIDAPIPTFVHVLENKQEGWMDENQEYEVVQFTPNQMTTFVHHIGNWTHGRVSPYSLINIQTIDVGTDQDPMYDKTHPLPRGRRTGYYFSSISKRFPNQNEWYTTRKAYFLDTKTRILYVFYDDSQWG